MNSNALLNDSMTLEEKLEAINTAMNDDKFKQEFNKRNGRALNAPVDPSDLTMCEGCQ